MRVEARSKAKKKNALLRPSYSLGIRIGPPMPTASRFCRRMVGVCAPQKNPPALSFSLRMLAMAEPWKALVPDLVV